LIGFAANFGTGEIGNQLVQPLNLYPGLLGRPNGDLSHQRQFSQELQFTGTLGRHKYTAGLYYFKENVSESYIVNYTIPITDLLGPGTGVTGLQGNGGLNYTGESESYAAYASDSWTPPILDDKLELTGGIRVTKDIKTLDYLTMPQFPTVAAHKHRAFSNVSGDFTAKYQWTPDVMTYARFANAYKSGGFSGRDDPLAPGFTPETANNFEVGTKSDWLDKRLRVNADVFYTKYNDKQVTTFASGGNNNGIQSSHVTNAATTKYLGADVEITARPTENLTLEANWGHTWPKFERFDYQPVLNGPIFNISGSARFNYFPKTTYSLAGTYTFDPLPIGELSARVEYSYRSGMYFHPSNQFNPLNELIKAGAAKDLSASINLSKIPVGWDRSEISLSVYGKNLLNKAWRIQGTDYEFTPEDYFGSSAYNRPRVIGFHVTARY
jgi:iron complex outermembrane receptor protein